MTAPAYDTLRVNDEFVSVAPHHWTMVSRSFTYRPERTRLRKFLDRITFRPETEEDVVVVVHVRVPSATDMKVDLVGPAVMQAGEYRRLMRQMSVQD